MDLALVLRWYPIGSNVVAHLSGGRSARGRVQAIDTDSLILVTETGPILLLAKAIEQIEPAAIVSSDPPSMQATLPPQPAAPSREWNRLRDRFKFDTKSIETTAPAFKRDASIPMSYSDAKEIEKHLNRVKNRLESSSRDKDSGRALNAIRDLVGAAIELQYPPACHLAALLLLQRTEGAGSQEQAIEWMLKAAPYGARYASDLAAVYWRAGRPQDAAAALAAWLRISPADQTDDELLRAFLALVLRGEDISLPIAVLAAANTGAKQRLVAVRAGLFLVAELAPDRAPALEPLLSLTNARSEDLACVLEALEPGGSAQYGTAAAEPIRATPSPLSSTGLMTRQSPEQQPPRQIQADNSRGNVLSPPRTHNDPGLRVSAAQRQLDTGRFEQALKIAQRALDEYPEHPELLAIIEAARHEQPSGFDTIPASRRPAKAQTVEGRPSLYAQAQRAETEEKDLAKAETLYRQAIAQGGVRVHPELLVSVRAHV